MFAEISGGATETRSASFGNSQSPAVEIPSAAISTPPGSRPSTCIPVGCWILDLVPAGEGLFRADYLGRLGYEEEALQELGEGRSSSALLAFLDWRIQWRETLWKKLRAQVPEWAPGDISDAQRFLLEGRLHVENSEASLARLSRGTVSWREAYAPMIVAVGSHLVELEAQYPGHPWLLERRLSLLTPHLSPVEPDQLLDEELDLACELMEGLA